MQTYILVKERNRDMNDKNIKVGDIGYLRVIVINVDDDGWFKFRTDEKNLSFVLHSNEVAQAFTPLPKYDPNRKFREKDKVRVKCEVHGRPVYITKGACVPTDPNDIWEVVEEKETGWVHLKRGCAHADAWHDMLELVTPVEELDPYSVTHSADTSEECGCFEVVRDEQCASIYPYGTHETRYYKKAEHAKAAAEAECKRLNEEWRKEKE